MVLFRYMGFIFIEVKHKKKYGRNQEFYINHEEAKKYQRFRDVFGHEVWYAISNSDEKFKKWYWLPSRQAMRYPRIKTDDGLCIRIPAKDFIQVESFAAFTQMLLKTHQEEQ